MKKYSEDLFKTIGYSKSNLDVMVRPNVRLLAGCMEKT